MDIELVGSVIVMHIQVSWLVLIVVLLVLLALFRRK